jgi:transposase
MIKKALKYFSSDFKAKVALEAVQGVKTHPVQVGKWKKELHEQVGLST